MEVSVEQTGDLERRMKVQVPADEIDSAVEERLRSLSKRVKLAGFRPGKVPMKVVRSRYGDEVRREVLGEVMQRSFYQAMQQEQIQPVGEPQIEPSAGESGQDLEFVATFEVYPDVTVQGLDEIQVERPSAEITEEDVDNVLERMRGQQATYEEVERPAQEGDQVTVSYEGRVDGEEFTGNKADNVPLILGAGRYMEDLEKGLEGAAPGEERKINVTFPEDYRSEEVAGKQAEFTVQVHKVAEPQLPALDAEFAKGFGIEDGDLETLRREVRENMERERDEAIKNQVKRQVLDQVVEKNDITVPRAMLDQETERLRQEMAGQLQGQISAENLPAEMFEQQARRRVVLGLVMGQIIKDNDIQLDNERVEQTIQSMASTYEQPEQVVQWYHQNRQLMEGVEAMVMEEQVVDWLLEQAQVTDKQATFDEVVSAQHQ